MSDYALAVRRRAARLFGFDGSSANAQLYLRDATARGPSPETVAERLNALDGEFLPCEIGGETALVNLEWIAYVECPAGAEPARPEDAACRRAPVDLELVTGETLAGDLVFVARPGRARVSDLLNSTSDRFLHLVTAGVDRYVRRGAILRVRS